jgi:hypothetical protein
MAKGEDILRKRATYVSGFGFLIAFQYTELIDESRYQGWRRSHRGCWSCVIGFGASRVAAIH